MKNKPKKALFLDRDGVINLRLIDDYVKSVDEFELLPGVRESLHLLAKHYDYLFVVTNQQGIGKNLMQERDLVKVHAHMEELIGFPFTQIFFCPHLKSADCACRKPKPGMALQAFAAYPDIDLSRSLMIGDSNSDIEFAANAGIPAIHITDQHQAHPYARAAYASLHAYVRATFN